MDMDGLFSSSDHSALISNDFTTSIDHTSVVAAVLNSTTSHDVIRNCSSYTTCELTSLENVSTTQLTIKSDEPWRVALIVVGCGLIIGGTIIGNLLVCTAVGLVRKLRTPSNLLIVSLATSDLLVACLVMPLAALYDAQNRWTLGKLVCDIWTSLDVMLCTASILNLCAISIDRYLIITRPLRYALKRTKLHMLFMIAVVWVTSALISIPPLFGWKDGDTSGQRQSRNINQCVLSQAKGYQFYATIGAFYLPLAVMVIIYTRIYLVSSRIARSEERSRPSAAIFSRHRSRAESSTSGLLRDQVSIGPNPSEREAMLGPRGTNGTVAPNGQHHSNSFKNGQYSMVNGQGRVDGRTRKILKLLNPCCSCCIMSSSTNHDTRCGCLTTPSSKRLSSYSSSGGRGRSLTLASVQPLPQKRERKATKTLGVIMGAFVACWLPFFVVALVRPFVLDIPSIVTSLLQWLGYANSFLNPIIYARFNRDFRGPFKDIVTFRCRGINSRQRLETYAEQFGAYDALHVSNNQRFSSSENRESRAVKSGSFSAPEPNSPLNFDAKHRISAPDIVDVKWRDSTVV